MIGSGFDLLCEIDPPTRPDLAAVRRQITAFLPVVTRFIVPDNPLGKACLSGLAVAHEVEQAGGRSLVCLNARDRNALGFRRDLLTAAAYGIRRRAEVGWQARQFPHRCRAAPRPPRWRARAVDRRGHARRGA